MALGGVQKTGLGYGHGRGEASYRLMDALARAEWDAYRRRRDADMRAWLILVGVFNALSIACVAVAIYLFAVWLVA